MLFRSCGDFHRVVFLRLLDGLLGPGAGLDVAGDAVLHQVHGDHGELDVPAALDEEYFVVVRDAHELAQVRLRLGQNVLENLGIFFAILSILLNSKNRFK